MKVRKFAMEPTRADYTSSEATVTESVNTMLIVNRAQAPMSHDRTTSFPLFSNWGKQEVIRHHEDVRFTFAPKDYPSFLDKVNLRSLR